MIYANIREAKPKRLVQSKLRKVSTKLQVEMDLEKVEKQGSDERMQRRLYLQYKKTTLHLLHANVFSTMCIVDEMTQSECLLSNVIHM